MNVVLVILDKVKMGVTNKSDLQRDERLAIEVKKYECLYDKSVPGYKEKDKVANAWREVDKALVLEQGELSLKGQKFLVARLPNLLTVMRARFLYSRFHFYVMEAFLG